MLQKYSELNKEEKEVILNKGTERAFSGIYFDNKEEGIYYCKQCNTPLFESKSKFDSGTGWPSFDDIIDSNVKEIADEDGSRTEIVCSNCKGHLGHLFKGEGFTKKSVRHCVNSISLNFTKKQEGET
jgi:methionine-R-sulfoxide reductase